MPEKDAGKAAGAAQPGEKRFHRQPSIKDIARLARVSHPTVSRALQNSPLVNAATAARIRKIAEDSGYRASAVARGLVTRRSMTIGLVVNTAADPFANEVACGIEEAANDHGYAIFHASSNADPDCERNLVQAFAERRVDGIIVTSSRVGALYLPLLAELNVPIVMVNGQHPGTLVHSVTIANQEGSRAAVEHLIGLGHRRIAYIGDRNGYQSDAERLAGYKGALAGAGIDFAGELYGGWQRRARSRHRGNGCFAQAEPSAHGGLLLQRHDGAGSHAGHPRAGPARARRRVGNRIRRSVFCMVSRSALDYGTAADARHGPDGDGKPLQTHVGRGIGGARQRGTATDCARVNCECESRPNPQERGPAARASQAWAEPRGAAPWVMEAQEPGRRRR